MNAGSIHCDKDSKCLIFKLFKLNNIFLCSNYSCFSFGIRHCLDQIDIDLVHMCLSQMMKWRWCFVRFTSDFILHIILQQCANKAATSLITQLLIKRSMAVFTVSHQWVTGVSKMFLWAAGEIKSELKYLVLFPFATQEAVAECNSPPNLLLRIPSTALMVGGGVEVPEVKLY